MCVHKDPKSGETKGPGSPLATKTGAQFTQYLPQTATIAWAAGLPIEQEFMKPSGRPMTVGNRGKLVMAVFAQAAMEGLRGDRWRAAREGRAGPA